MCDIIIKITNLSDIVFFGMCNIPYVYEIYQESGDLYFGETLSLHLVTSNVNLFFTHLYRSILDKNNECLTF